MAYAYILTHEGTPCMFYPHFYAVTQHDVENPSLEVTAPSDLQQAIRQLIDIRRQYLGGTLSVLTESDKHLYVARRQGNGQKDGAIIVLNNHDTDTLSITLNVNPDGFPSAMTAKPPSQPPNVVTQFGLSNRDKKMKQNLPVRYVLLSKSPKTLNICSDFHPRHPISRLCRGLLCRFPYIYLSRPLILALMLLTDTRFTSRIAAMASSSKWRSSCMMRKMYCAVERPLYLRSHSCQRFGRS